MESHHKIFAGYLENSGSRVDVYKRQLKQVAGEEEFTITQNGEPEAKLSTAQAHAGSLPGKIWLSPDFDAPLAGFKDYMK